MERIDLEIEDLKESELNNQLKSLKNKDVIIEIIEDFKTRIEF